MSARYDVVVVGGGNAALCAALAARDGDAATLVLERAPFKERGGNSAFTAGAMRFAYNGADDIISLVPDLSPEQIGMSDFGSYTEDQFLDDMARVTEFRTDPDLCEILVRRSLPALRWMQGKGVRFLPIYGRQAYLVNGRFTFWGGLTLEVVGGGQGLIDALTRAAGDHGATIRYGARAVSLITEGEQVTGVRYLHNGEEHTVLAGAVVLASGGFEANAEWRTRYLGPGWDLAKVRGTRFNTGDGIRMALDAGAMSWGNWSGSHAVGWDLNAPAFGDLAVGDGFQKHSYPLGILINSRGERFVDEGADFRNYTYAKYGRVILDQPGHFAWQVFDHKVAHLLRDEYRIRQVTKVTADSIEELASRLDGVDPAAATATIREYNEAVRAGIPFNPNLKDGRGTSGLAVDKTNWANTIDTPPFEAYAVTCGITFTFGGLRISRDAQVIDAEGNAMSGLYAAGELVGGLFYFNYPGGTGLTSGSVFGRIAGTAAARHAVAPAATTPATAPG
jgi:tricarballylate dehydrogenase